MASWSGRHNGGPHNSGTRTEPPHSPGTGAAAALLPKGPAPMMYDLNLTAALSAAVLVALGAVYVWSADPGRRDRAWRLLQLLFRR
jgi:hypothetical protein